jgi:hypothetical protein
MPSGTPWTSERPIPASAHGIEAAPPRSSGSSAKLTDKALRRGVFDSLPDLIAAIEEYLQANNANRHRLCRLRPPNLTLEKVGRGRVALAAMTN